METAYNRQDKNSALTKKGYVEGGVSPLRQSTDPQNPELMYQVDRETGQYNMVDYYTRLKANPMATEDDMVMNIMLPEITVTGDDVAYWTPISESNEEWEALSLDEKLERYDQWYSNPNNTPNVPGTDEFNSTREDLINDHYKTIELKKEQSAGDLSAVTYDGSGGTGTTPGAVAANQTETERREANLGDNVDLTLSLAGMAPVWGVFADGANVVQNLAQVGYNLVTMDWDEAVHDLKNTAWALAGMIPIFGGAFTSLRFGKVLGKTVKGDSLRNFKNADEMQHFINTASDKAISLDPRLTQAEKVEIFNARYNMSISAAAAKGGNVRGVDYYTNAVHYGVLKTSDDVTETIYGSGGIIAGQRAYGESVDLANRGFNAMTDLSVDNVRQIGYQNGRAIFEVTYPSGHTQRFWRSTGGGGKTVRVPDGKGGFKEVTSEGFFGTLPGHVDYNLSPAEITKHLKKQGYVNDANRAASDPERFANAAEEYKHYERFYQDSKSWFVKGNDWQGYGSQQFQTTGAKLKEMFDNGELKVVKELDAVPQ
jgi:hypothetical protein